MTSIFAQSAGEFNIRAFPLRFGNLEVERSPLTLNYIHMRRHALSPLRLSRWLLTRRRLLSEHLECSMQPASLVLAVCVSPVYSGLSLAGAALYCNRSSGGSRSCPVSRRPVSSRHLVCLLRVLSLRVHGLGCVVIGVGELVGDVLARVLDVPWVLVPTLLRLAHNIVGDVCDLVLGESAVKRCGGGFHSASAAAAAAAERVAL